MYRLTFEICDLNGLHVKTEHFFIENYASLSDLNKISGEKEAYIREEFPEARYNVASKRVACPGI